MNITGMDPVNQNRRCFFVQNVPNRIDPQYKTYYPMYSIDAEMNNNILPQPVNYVNHSQPLRLPQIRSMTNIPAVAYRQSVETTSNNNNNNNQYYVYENNPNLVQRPDLFTYVNNNSMNHIRNNNSSSNNSNISNNSNSINDFQSNNNIPINFQNHNLSIPQNYIVNQQFPVFYNQPKQERPIMNQPTLERPIINQPLITNPSIGNIVYQSNKADTKPIMTGNCNNNKNEKADSSATGKASKSLINKRTHDGYNRVYGFVGWQKREDKLLKHLRKDLNYSWKQIGQYFPDRTINACQSRLRRICKRNFIYE